MSVSLLVLSSGISFFLLAAVFYRVGLPGLVAAMLAGPLLALLFNFVVHFGFSRPVLAPNWKAFSLPHADRLIRTGLLFFVLQALTLLALSVDNLIIAAKGGDMQAARLLIERAIPTLRAAEATVTLDLPEDAPLSEQGSAILRAVADGRVDHASLTCAQPIRFQSDVTV